MPKTTIPKPKRKQPNAAPPRNDIAQGDCIALMDGWAEDSVDLIFADPPYNIGFKYDQYKDTLDCDKYIEWTKDWINGATRLLKPSGSMYILIGDEYAAETRLHLKQLQQEGKLLFRNWIIWHYTFGQRCKVKYNRSHAHLFYCVGSAALNPKTCKPKTNIVKNPPFTFNYDAVAVPSARMTTYNDHRQNPKGKLPDDTWVLKFPAMENWHIRPQGAAEEGAFDTGSDTWYQSRLAGTFKEREQWHPCQLPEALLDRIVRCSSNEGHVVFDPFAGSGTTLAVANKLDRDWLGCEMSADYRKRALERINNPDARKDEKVVTKTGKRAGRKKKS